MFFEIIVSEIIVKSPYEGCLGDGGGDDNGNGDGSDCHSLYEEITRLAETRLAQNSLK